MRVIDAYKSGIHTQETTGAKPVGHAPPAAKGAAPDRDGDADDAAASVHVSDAARAMAAKSGVDEAKVARLRDAVANGSFKVDAQAIASRLVDGD